MDRITESQHQRWGQLMSAAQGGDRDAYEQLLRDITPFIRALLRRRCPQEADLQEVVQETLLTVHRVRHTYDPARPFVPWLSAIAMRRAIDGARRRQRVSRHEITEEALPETFAEAPANNEVEASDSARRLQELLSRLPPRQRSAVEAVKLRELSLAEAAQVSGQTVGALKVNVHRALKTLRGWVGNRD
jgi:RNA polymerase sigma-70 factor (ECF subfamily)